ncbi:flagellar biosynthetic protein FliO [Luteimonas viscosa]|uniref:Flagellar protein n=1 Tax=Luteimonas viscosa TaxID=1132694 RepID=A0A5D4XU03_9GAMM|nr:flagellar biosynthetic protein FliO [Luteimonas viscosa]
MPASGADDATAAAPATAAEAFAARAGATDRPAIPATTTAQAGVPVTTPQSPANAGTLGGAVFALVLVVGLILLLSKLAKRMPGLGGASANPALRIVGSLALGPRDRLVVVEVGDTQLLLGVGAGGTRTLHTLDQPLPAVAAKSAPAPFAQLLAQHFGKKP